MHMFSSLSKQNVPMSGSGMPRLYRQVGFFSVPLRGAGDGRDTPDLRLTNNDDNGREEEGVGANPITQC